MNPFGPAYRRWLHPGGLTPQEFADPPADCRMLPIIHGWSHDHNAVSRQIETVKQHGYGGFVTNVSFHDGYVENPAHWETLRFVLKQARSLGLETWLYDENGYPSGRAGDIVLRGHPEWQTQGLFCSDALTRGATVTLPVPPGRLLAAVALPVQQGVAALDGAIDLTAEVTENGLTWRPSSGRWHVLVFSTGNLFTGTQIDGSAYPVSIPYVDLLNPAVTQRFLQVTHEAYAEKIGMPMGEAFTSTFTDEPSLMALFFHAQPWRVLPWTPAFEREAPARMGLPLARALAVLVADTGPTGRPARCAYWALVRERMLEAFWLPIRRWCEAHAIPSGGHNILEENILYHCCMYGDMMAAFRAMHVPGIDCLSSDPMAPPHASLDGMGPDIPWNAARYAASAAELEGNALVMCEVSEHMQRMSNPQKAVNPAMVRATLTRLILGGVNAMLSYGPYQFSESELQQLNLWNARLCGMTRGGIHAADVAVVYPIETVWSRFAPSRHWMNQVPEEAGAVEHCLRAVSQSLFAGRREFLYTDSKALAAARVSNGQLVHGRHRWKVVVLPWCDTLPADAWKRLGEFVRSGGRVVVIGPTPAASTVQVGDPVALEAARLIGASSRCVRLDAAEAGRVSAVIDRMVRPDMVLKPGGEQPIRMVHIRHASSDVYLIANDGPSPWNGTVDLPVRRAGERMDPGTGVVTSLASARDIALDLEPWGAVVLRFPR